MKVLFDFARGQMLRTTSIPGAKARSPSSDMELFVLEDLNLSPWP